LKNKKTKSFAFNLRELAGSMGDLGTLLPLSVGYIFVCGLNPAGILVMMGCVNIVMGLAYKIPMPLQPMKVAPQLKGTVKIRGSLSCFSLF
jgi:hypothetical protein